MAEQKLKKVCKCENCHNEAEMVITCSLEPVEVENKSADTAPSARNESGKVRGQAVCSHCGNEADMWVDLD